MTTEILNKIKSTLEDLDIDYNINNKNTHISVVMHTLNSDEKVDKSFRVQLIPMEPLNAFKIVVFNIFSWKKSEFDPKLYEWVNKLNQDLIYGNLMLRNVDEEYRLTYTHGVCVKRGDTMELSSTELEEIFIYIAFLITHIFILKKEENFSLK